MGRWGLIIASCALLAATSAHAQLTNASGSGSSTTELGGGSGSGGVTVDVGQGDGNIVFNANGGAFKAITEVTSDHVSFESGNAVTGPNAFSTSTSGVDVEYTNLTGHNVAPVFESTIIPAGLGFYLQDRNNCVGNILTGCGESLSPYTFDDLSPSAGYTNGVPFASAGFDFVINNGETELYTLSGSLTMSFVDGQLVIDDSGLNTAAGFLNGFTQVTPGGSNTAIGFAWDATDFLVPLGSVVAPFDVRTLTYTATVYAESHVGCITADVCLVGYSGFGDPIGRGGGVESLVSFSSKGSFSLYDVTPGITGIVFDQVDFQPFRIASENEPGGGAVPEPATWALMLIGFGSLGAALRRQRALASA